MRKSKLGKTQSKKARKAKRNIKNSRIANNKIKKEKKQRIAKKRKPVNNITDLPEQYIGKDEICRKHRHQTKELSDRLDQEMIVASNIKRAKTLPLMEIKRIRFSFVDQEELEKNPIVVTDVYNPARGGTQGTLADLRFGSMERDVRCGTCRKSSADCPGHEGVIKLPVLVYNPQYMREIIKTLNSVCEDCGSLMVPKKQLKEMGILDLPPVDRLTAIEKLSASMNKCLAPDEVTFETEDGTVVKKKKKKCRPHLEYLKPATKTDREIYVGIGPKQKGKYTQKAVRDIQTVYDILDNIDDETARALGFGDMAAEGEIVSKPVNMIIKNMVAIPPCLRAEYNNGKWKDGFATQYSTIVAKAVAIEAFGTSTKRTPGKKYSRRSELTPESTKPGPVTKDQLVSGLAASIESLIIGNGEPASGKGSKEQSVKSKMSTKEGEVRSTVIGKRVNMSARSVLSPGSTLKFGEIGIPRQMARVLTMKERVTLVNINRIKFLWSKGKVTHRIPSRGNLYGRRINIEKSKMKNRKKKHWKIEVGDIVSRHAVDGDYIIFNRQPTLHRGSIMGYRIKLHDGLTIKIHLASTSPHNADFDGDEGTLHFVQTIAAQAEASTIMSAVHNIISGQNSRPMVSVIFNALTGAYQLTRDGIYLTREQTSSMIMSIIDYVDANLVGNEIPGNRLFWDRIEYVEDVNDGVDGKVEYYNWLGDKVTAEPFTNIDGVRLYPKIIMGRLRKYNLRPNSGKAIFSMLLPHNLFYKRGGVVIEEGILISGRISKKDIGSSNASLIHRIKIQHGTEAIRDFLTYAYFLLNSYLESTGFSISGSDCMGPIGPLRDRMNRIAREEIAKAKEKAQRYGPPRENPIDEAIRERDVSGALNIASTIGTKVVKEMLQKSGAKVDKKFNKFFEESSKYDLTYNLKGKIERVKVEGDYLEGKDKMLVRIVRKPKKLKSEENVKSILDGVDVLDEEISELEAEKDMYESFKSPIEDEEFDSDEEKVNRLLSIYFNTSLPQPGEGITDPNPPEYKSVPSSSRKLNRYLSKFEPKNIPKKNRKAYELFAKNLLNRKVDVKYNKVIYTESENGLQETSSKQVSIQTTLLKLLRLDPYFVKSNNRFSKKLNMEPKPLTTLTNRLKSFIKARKINSNILSKRTAEIEDLEKNISNADDLVKSGEMTEGEVDFMKDRLVALEEEKDKLISNIETIDNMIIKYHSKVIEIDVTVLSIFLKVFSEIEVKAFKDKIDELREKITRKTIRRNREIDRAKRVDEVYDRKRDDVMLLLLEHNPDKNVTYRGNIVVDGKTIEISEIIYGVSSIEPIDIDKTCTERAEAIKGGGPFIPTDYDELIPENNLVVMATSGSKGSVGHIARMLMFLGQQYQGGERIKPTLQGSNRCSIYTRRDPKRALDPEDRGFCVNSFLSGLSPKEYYFHMTASREGLTNTAIRTQITGEYQRRVSKAMENVKINMDGTVRDPNGNIIQDVYGEDGLNPSELINIDVDGQNIPFFISLQDEVNSLNTEL